MTVIKNYCRSILLADTEVALITYMYSVVYSDVWEGEQYPYIPES